MRQPIRASALLAVFIGVVVPAGTARAQDRAREPTISAMPLPGGLAAVRKIASDEGRSDAGQLFIDVIRRSFQTPVAVRGMRREAVIRPILDHLDRAAKASLGPPAERLPLPLTAEVWIQSILEAGAKKETLAADILRSSSASLMYCGLLALDDATRRWFAEHGDVLADIAARHAAHFFIAAPGLRIRDNVAQLPGGARAAVAWESAVGKRASDPAAFIKAVVGRNEVALPYFIGSFAQLDPEQARAVLAVEGAEQARTTAIRRMVTAFDRVSTGWDAIEKPFWRPTLDPALLVSDLRPRENGAPNLPGTTAFWSAVFSSSEPGRETPDAISPLVTGPPVEFSWLCEQIFTGGQTLTRPPYQLVLFASRQLPAITPGNARDALDALRGASQFPAVAGTLERARITRLSAYAAVAQRARAILAIDDEARAQMALVQFQGALTVIARAAARGGFSPDRAADLVSSLSAISLDAHGEYAGKVVEWVSDALLAGEGRAGAATAADASDGAIRARRRTAGAARGPGRGSRPRRRMGRHAISRQLHQRRGVPSPAPVGRVSASLRHRRGHAGPHGEDVRSGRAVTAGADGGRTGDRRRGRGNALH